VEEAHCSGRLAARDRGVGLVDSERDRHDLGAVHPQRRDQVAAAVDDGGPHRLARASASARTPASSVWASSSEMSVFVTV
jgi:hypothetical protein